MQRLFLIMWPFWLPRAERQAIVDYFQEDYQWTHPMVRGDSDG